MSNPTIELKILDDRLADWGLPEFQSEMAAAIDLRACLDAPLTLWPGSQAWLISAGFSIHMASSNMAAMILPRSGMGHNKGLVLGNSVGLIDPDYTGPIKVSAWNRNTDCADPIVLIPGERFALRHRLDHPLAWSHHAQHAGCRLDDRSSMPTAGTLDRAASSRHVGGL